MTKSQGLHSFVSINPDKLCGTGAAFVRSDRTAGARIGATATFHMRNSSELVDISEALGKEWVFRGQTAKTAGISSSLEREIDRLYIPNRSDWLNSHIASEFESSALEKIKSAPPVDPCIDWSADDNYSWLALLQHHGCKTRMVDFAESFYIALHFALRDLPAEQDAAVWAIRTSALDEKTAILLQKDGGKFSKEEIGRQLVENSISWPDRYSDRADYTVVYGKPKHLNQRMIAQQGLFLCPLNLNRSFMDNLATGLDLTIKDESVKKLCDLDELEEAAKAEKVLKILVPRLEHPRLLHLLRGMNISDATLFPGIDGFARSLNYFLC